MKVLRAGQAEASMVEPRSKKQEVFSIYGKCQAVSSQVDTIDSGKLC